MKDVQALEWVSQENIASLLKDTDRAITRWSATTLAEIDTFGVKKIIIPLPHAADNHQYWNAREYENTWDILLEQSQIHHLKSIIDSQLWQNSQPSDISQKIS
jgi:UDP-N-acetylglucosamine:LPS N-acetylglucosamine transferase